MTDVVITPQPSIEATFEGESFNVFEIDVNLSNIELVLETGSGSSGVSNAFNRVNVINPDGTTGFVTSELGSNTLTLKSNKNVFFNPDPVTRTVTFSTDDVFCKPYAFFSHEILVTSQTGVQMAIDSAPADLMKTYTTFSTHGTNVYGFPYDGAEIADLFVNQYEKARRDDSVFDNAGNFNDVTSAYISYVWAIKGTMVYVWIGNGILPAPTKIETLRYCLIKLGSGIYDGFKLRPGVYVSGSGEGKTVVQEVILKQVPQDPALNLGSSVIVSAAHSGFGNLKLNRNKAISTSGPANALLFPPVSNSDFFRVDDALIEISEDFVNSGQSFRNGIWFGTQDIYTAYNVTFTNTPVRTRAKALAMETASFEFNGLVYFINSDVEGSIFLDGNRQTFVFKGCNLTNSNSYVYTRVDQFEFDAPYHFQLLANESWDVNFSDDSLLFYDCNITTFHNDFSNFPESNKVIGWDGRVGFGFVNTKVSPLVGLQLRQPSFVRSTADARITPNNASKIWSVNSDIPALEISTFNTSSLPDVPKTVRTLKLTNTGTNISTVLLTNVVPLYYPVTTPVVKGSVCGFFANNTNTKTISVVFGIFGGNLVTIATTSGAYQNTAFTVEYEILGNAGDYNNSTNTSSTIRGFIRSPSFATVSFVSHLDGILSPSARVTIQGQATADITVIEASGGYSK